MYCKNCGKEMNENAVVCLNCGVSKGTGRSYCSSCGETVSENAVICLKCGASVSANGNDVEKGKKTKIIAGLLALFLGHLGIHWFYLGFTSKGIKNIIIHLLSLVSSFVGGGLIGLGYETDWLWLIGGVICFFGFLGALGLGIYNIVIAVKIFTDKQKDTNGNVLS